MDRFTLIQKKGAGKLSLTAFFLGALALFLDFASAAALSSSVGTGSDIEYIQFKASNFAYVFGDLGWILSALLFAYVVVSFALSEDKQFKLPLGGTLALTLGLTIFALAKTVHLAPSHFVKEMGPQISVITGAIYSDLISIYHVVTALSHLSLALIGVGALFVGHAFLQEPKADRMLGFFMEVAGVFALSTVLIYLARSVGPVFEVSFIGLVGNATYNLFHFLFLLMMYRWGMFLLGMRSMKFDLSDIDQKGGMNGEEKTEEPANRG